MESLYEVGAYLNLLPTVSAAKLVLFSCLEKTVDFSLLALAMDVTRGNTRNLQRSRRVEARLRRAGVLGAGGIESLDAAGLGALTREFLDPLVEVFADEDEPPEEETAPDHYTEEGLGEVDAAALRLAQLERPAFFLATLPAENSHALRRMLAPQLIRELDDVDVSNLLFAPVQLGSFYYSLVRVKALSLTDLLAMVDGPVAMPPGAWDRLAGVLADFSEPDPEPVEIPRARPSLN